MSKLNDQIKEYLKDKNPDYFTGLELYSAHPKARRNIVLACEQRSKHGTQQKKLIYELEKIVGVKKHSGKRAIVRENPKTSFNIIKETTAEAPKDYEYSVKYEDLPEELKKLVIEKGEKYNQLQMLKKKLQAFGKKNDDKSVSARMKLGAEMQVVSNRIKDIHSFLSEFESPEMQELVSKRDLINEKLEDAKNEVAKLAKSLGVEDVRKILDLRIEIERIQRLSDKLKDNTDENSIAIIEENNSKIEILEKRIEQISENLNKEELEKHDKALANVHELQEESNQLQEQIDKFNKTFEFEPKDVKKEVAKEWNEDTLDEEYNYKEMTWAERKILFNKLQSSVGKQLQRSKESKTEKAREQNKLKALKGGAMLEILKKYFEENPEAPKK